MNMRRGIVSKYPGLCGKCHTHVKAGYGLVFKVDGKWTLYCQMDAKDRITTCFDPLPAKYQRKYVNADGYGFYS